ncbi:replicase, partial [Klebsiella pneumoniae]
CKNPLHEHWLVQVWEPRLYDLAWLSDYLDLSSYGLDTPIRTAPDGNAAPLRYAAAIEAALREKLGADMGYSGLICKNPLHEHWLVQVWEPRLYDLAWLSDYLDLSSY